jgi:hypothetical protein
VITEPRWTPAQVQPVFPPRPVPQRHDIRVDRETFAAVLDGQTELRLPVTDASAAIDYADVLHLIESGNRRCCCRMVTRVRSAPVQKIVSVTILPGPGVCVGMHIW